MVQGRGEIPARRRPALTTATPEGAVTSMEALSWPCLDLLLEHRGKPFVQGWTRQRRRLSMPLPFLKALFGLPMEYRTRQLEMV